MLPGDLRRRSEPANEADRLRTVEVLRSVASEGGLSSIELSDRVELAFRARSLGELDALTEGLSSSPEGRAALIMSGALSPGPKRRRRRSFVERQLLLAGAFLVFWVLVCALTHSSAIWYLVTILGSLTGLCYRLARGERRKSTLRGSRRSRG